LFARQAQGTLRAVETREARLGTFEAARPARVVQTLMKILIIEDETKTEQYLRRGLTEAGFTVNGASDGSDGLHLAVTEDYDLVVLDVMLPALDGWEVLQRLRGAQRHMPVLMLTARDQVVDRVKGLELGADDYLLKPFDFAELLARVRALLRRGKAAPVEALLRVADLELNRVSRRVTRAGRRLALTAKEFALLELLMRREGEVLPRSLIASQVWDMNFDSDTNVVEVAMRRLRTKVDNDFEFKLIRTLRGMGYVLEAPA
jgi:two-component system copper resistance phosphate regulon response regulator CusR